MLSSTFLGYDVTKVDKSVLLLSQTISKYILLVYLYTVVGLNIYIYIYPNIYIYIVYPNYIYIYIYINKLVFN